METPQVAGHQEYSYNASQQEYSQNPDSSAYYMNQGTNPGAVQAQPQPNPSNFKLGWHKWIIYVVLWVNALLYLSDAVQVFNMMNTYGVHDTTLTLLCLVSIGIAIFGVYLRFQLARFKKGAPKKVLIFALLITAFDILIMVAFGTDNQAATVIPPLAWWLLTWRYYTKREELFVN